MKKIIETLRKKDIDVLVFLLIVISGITLFVLVNCEDELWNFANCYKMFNGYKIYKELNVIITPLFFYKAQIFFKIFGSNMLVFRIYNSVIYTVLFLLIYQIFKQLKITKLRAFLYITIILPIFCGMIAGGGNYNILAIIPILIAILLIFKEKQNNLLLGILLFLTFLSKQNIYVLFAIGIFLYKFSNKGDIKTKILDLSKIYIVSIIGIVAFCIYLYLDNNLYDFINYCFLGINEFGTNNVAISFWDALYLYISLIAIIFTIFALNNRKIKKCFNEITAKNVKVLLSFGIPLLLIAYPIANYFHNTLGSIVILIELIYFLEEALIKDMQFKNKKGKILYILTIFILVMYMDRGLVLAIFKNDNLILHKDKAFYGSYMYKEDYKDIQIICNYIKEQEKNNIDVKILSYKANLYMVNLNKNNELFDLAFLGNLGKGGENNLINELKKLDNTIILIQTDEEKISWQESKKARNYIINNFIKLGEIQEYSIYYKK